MYRWSELHRLEYFDAIRFSVVDPIHNFSLGITSKIVALGRIRDSRQPNAFHYTRSCIHISSRGEIHDSKGTKKPSEGLWTSTASSGEEVKRPVSRMEKLTIAALTHSFTSRAEGEKDQGNHRASVRPCQV